MRTSNRDGFAAQRRWALTGALMLAACHQHHGAASHIGTAGARALDASVADASSAHVMMGTPSQQTPSTSPAKRRPESGASAEPASDADQTANQPHARKPTARMLKLALFGDQGVGASARSVLSLVADEHADAVIHLGDFAYDEASPTGWLKQVDSVLGAQFPYFAVIGNHDVAAWGGSTGFAERLSERLKSMPEARCQGEYGVDSICTFRGLAFVLSGVGTYGKDHESFLESALTDSDALFRLCIWHKNQHDMQVGSKQDEVGWEAYRICARHGVPIITGHEHSYGRTLLLAAVGSREQGHGAMGEPAQLVLEPGRTFVAVSGLGGESRRSRTSDHATDTWWASIYAQDYQLQNGALQGTAPVIQYGSLFIEFYVDDNPNKAHAYFKTVDGVIHDEFTFTVDPVSDVLRDD